MIPKRYHARLLWIGFLKESHWVSDVQTWESLWDLVYKLDPFIEGEESGREEESSSGTVKTR